jgi:hypothetical protein
MLRLALLQRAHVSRRVFASAAQSTSHFRGDETLVIRSPYADIPPIPNTSLSDIILKKSKSFSGADWSPKGSLYSPEPLHRPSIHRGVSAFAVANVVTAAFPHTDFVSLCTGTSSCRTESSKRLLRCILPGPDAGTSSQCMKCRQKSFWHLAARRSRMPDCSRRFAPNCIDYALVFHACALSGIIVSPVAPNFQAAELKQQLQVPVLPVFSTPPPPHDILPYSPILF